MNSVDIVIIVILLLATLNGFRQGFVLGLATILGAVVALAMAKAEYPDVRRVLLHVGSHSPWLTAISYLIVFLIIWAAIILVARRIRWLVHHLFLGWLDRLGGLIIGFLQGALVVAVLLYLGKRLPNRALHLAISHSSVAPNFLHMVPALPHLLPTL